MATINGCWCIRTDINESYFTRVKELYENTLNEVAQIATI